MECAGSHASNASLIEEAETMAFHDDAGQLLGFWCALSCHELYVCMWHKGLVCA